jgi:hypothetical protein
LRDYLNVILTFIGAPTLTDEEFDSLTITVGSMNKETYEALLEVLKARESVSTYQDRLFHFFSAKGIEVSAPDKGKSNIYVGGVL